MKTLILMSALMLAAIPAYAGQIAETRNGVEVDVTFKNGTTNYVVPVEGYAEHSFQVAGQNSSTAAFQGFSGTVTAYGRTSPSQKYEQITQITATGQNGYFLYRGYEIKYELIVRKNRAAFTATRNR